MIRSTLLLSTIFCAITYATHGANTPKPSMQNNATTSMIDFFSRIPKATLIASPFTNTIQQMFTTTLELPSTITGPINQLYSLIAQQAVHAYIDNIHPTIFNALTNAQMALQKAQASHDNQEVITQQTTITQLQQQITAIITKIIPQLTSICLKSSCWQNYMKLFVANSFDYEVSLLSQLHANEEQMFIYIPHFETAYYSDAYVKLRNGSETLRIFLIITDQARQRMLPLITDWAKLDSSSLYDTIQTFKKTDFYTVATAFHQALTSDPVAINGPITQGAKIATGFTKFLHRDNGVPTVIPALQNIMEIKNGTLFLIGPGTLLFKETTITNKANNSYATLAPSDQFHKLFEEEGAGYMPTPLYMELLAIQGIKLLVGATSYLFNAENVADTMAKLAKLSNNQRGVIDTKSQGSPFPNFLLYQPEDQLLLEELANCIATNNSLNPENQINPEGFWSDFCHAFSSAFGAIGNAFENFGNTLIGSIEDIARKVGDFVVHIATAVADVGKSFYYLTGLNCLVSGISGNGFNHYSLSNFNKYLADSASQLSDCVTDITSIVNDVADVAKDVVNLAATIVGQVAGAIMMDPGLATDLTGMINEIADTVINLSANTVNFFVKAVGDYVVLTYEAVETITRVIVDVLTGNAALAGQALGQMLNSVVSSVLNLATFVLSSIGSALKSIMAAVAFLVASITDLIIDISGYMAALFTGNWNENFEIRHEIGEHRQLINAIIMTGLSIAITVATFGAGAEMGAGMIALAVAGGVMTAGMSVLQIMSAVQQDSQTIEQTDDQINFLKIYEPYVANNARVTAANQNKVYAESLIKFDAEAQNQERGLVYYQNYLNRYYNNYYAIQAYNLSSFYNIITTPDDSTGNNPGIAPADPGYWYGIQTNRYDLNPSRGFRVYQKTTNSFCQEIAAPPAPTTQPTSLAESLMISPGQQSTTQAWLNQRDTAPATQEDLNNMDIRWRIIYDIDSPCYVGIYASERFMDPNQLHALHANFQAQQTNTLQSQFTPTWQALNTYNSALLDFNTGAKCFVMYKGMDQTSPIVGVYEHGGNGWLATNQTAITYERGAWYRMTAQLQPTTETTSQFKVWCWKEDVPGTTYEQAKSKWSASTQVNRATPMPGITTSQPSSSTKMLAPWQRLSIFGTPVSGWSIPPTPATVASNNYAGTFGVITSGAAVEYQILSPVQKINVTQARTASDTQVTTQLEQDNITPVETNRELIWQKSYEQNIYPTFGNTTLSPASLKEIQSGIYLYTTNKTGIPGTPLDYVVFIRSLTQTLQPNGLGISINSTPTPTYMVSLITGNVYNNQWQLQTQTYPNALELFQQTNILSSTVLTAIQNASAAYYKSEAGPFIFNNITITGNITSFISGNYIYTGPTLTPQLNGTDYFITAYYDTNQNTYTNSNIAITPNKATPINALISLITGKLFMLTKDGNTISSLQTNQAKFITVTATTTSFPKIFSALQNVPNSIQTLITSQKNLYQKAITPPVAIQQPVQPAPSQFSYTPPSNYSTGGNFGNLVDPGGNL